MRRFLLTIVACSAMLGFSTRASAAELSSRAGAGLDVAAAFPVHGTGDGTWLWSLLNPWASLSTQNLICEAGSRSGPGDHDNAGFSGCAASSGEENAALSRITTIQTVALLKFLVAFSEFSGSSQSSTSTNTPPPGPASQAGLPVKVEVLCFKTVARLVAEGNFLNVKDYVSNLFRPPRCLA